MLLFVTARCRVVFSLLILVTVPLAFFKLEVQSDIPSFPFMIYFGDCLLLELFEAHCSLDEREHRRKKGQWEIPPQEVNAIQTLFVTNRTDGDKSLFGSVKDISGLCGFMPFFHLFFIST